MLNVSSEHSFNKDKSFDSQHLLSSGINEKEVNAWKCKVEVVVYCI